MVHIIFQPLVTPKKEVVAYCSVCYHELSREPWEHYSEYNRKVKKIEKCTYECPHCRVTFKEKIVVPKWEKSGSDLIAKALNGDFLIWKWGYCFKWRYRKYGETQPESINYAKTKELAQKACAKHAEWRVV